MAGLIFGATNLLTTHGFNIEKSSFGSGELIWTTVSVPGREGEIILNNPRLKPGDIFLKGNIIATSTSDLKTKIRAIDLYLEIRRFNSAYDPVNFSVAPRTPKDLLHPFWEGYKFPECVCVSAELVLPNGWLNQSSCEYNILFSQKTPRMESV